MRGATRHLSAGVGRVIVVGFVMWCLAPFALMVRTSFASSGIAGGTFATGLGFDNYRQVLATATGSFVPSLVLSISLATGTALTCLLLGLPAAYALSRRRTAGMRAVGDWIFSTRFLPPIVAAIPLFVTLSTLGLAGNFASLATVDLLVGLAFTVWVSRSFLDDLPLSVEQLAFVDGFSLPRRLWSVLLPNVGLPLFAVGAMAWLFVWNEYLFGLLFSGATRPLTALIASWNTYQGVQWGPACAAGVLAALPAALLLFLSATVLVRGLVFGWRPD